MSYEIIEKARKSGKIRKGTNEVTKAIEREEAKLVVTAKDVSPPEVIKHLGELCKEKGIPCVEVEEKAKLGTAAGLAVPTASVAVVKEGDAKAEIEKLGKAKAVPAKPQPAKEVEKPVEKPQEPSQKAEGEK